MPNCYNDTVDQYSVAMEDFVMNRILPYKLSANDATAIFSPSCAATSWIPERTELAVQFLESHGHRIVRGSLTGKDAGYRSGTIEERAEELNALIRDPNVRCIMAAAGGFVSNSILSYIDYDALRRDPKIIVGYSDVTAVLLAVYAQTGLTTFYGPNLIPVFGEAMPYSGISHEYFRNIVFGTVDLPYCYPMPPYWTEDSVGLEETGVQCTAMENRWICVRKGKKRGRLIGGNLDTLYGIWGSEYMPEIRQGDILFLEENRGTPEKTERALSHLKLCGVFEKIGGLVLGKSADYRPGRSGEKFYEPAMEILGGYDFPVLAEFDCAHTKPMHTLPIGCTVELDADKKRLSLLDMPVK